MTEKCGIFLKKKKNKLPKPKIKKEITFYIFDCQFEMFHCMEEPHGELEERGAALNPSAR